MFQQNIYNQEAIRHTNADADAFNARIRYYTEYALSSLREYHRYNSTTYQFLSKQRPNSKIQILKARHSTIILIDKYS